MSDPLDLTAASPAFPTVPAAEPEGSPEAGPESGQKAKPGALLRDPTLIPVVAVDDHLPAVAPDRLLAAALVDRFVKPPLWQPEFTGDGRPVQARPPAAASVLLALIERDSGLQVLLTRRTAHLRDHAGQISFPGGRAEAQDADAIATALREAHEEVGLRPEQVRVIGQLPAYRTITAFDVTTVVALVTPPFELALDAFEVAEAFEVPLQFLMTPAHHRRHAFEVQGQQRQFLSMPWRPDGAAGGTAAAGGAQEYFIWGATAAMLRNFYRFLAAD